MYNADYLSTLDLKDAYRAVAIHPSDIQKQGLVWDFNGKLGPDSIYMVDNRLCMGLSSSPYIFSKLSDFITRCAVRHDINTVINYLDDFCLIPSDLATTKRETRILYKFQKN